MSIDALNRVIVGSGHFAERVPHMVEQANRVLVGIQRPEILEGATSAFGRAIEFIKHKSEKAAEYKDHALENLKKYGEAAGDIGQAYGYGAAGDLGGAYEKAVEGVAKAAEAFWENQKYWFGGGPK